MLLFSINHGQQFTHSAPIVSPLFMTGGVHGSLVRVGDNNQTLNVGVVVKMPQHISDDTDGTLVRSSTEREPIDLYLQNGFQQNA